MRPQVKAFLFKIVIALMPFLLLFAWTEYKARLLPNSFAIKKENFEQICSSVNILVLGSSHAMKGINPDFFSCKGFNFSNSSQTLAYDSKLCLKYLDRLPRLKAVILDISYFSFFFDLADSPEKWKSYFYYQYYGIRVPSIDLYSPRAFTRTALYTKGTIIDMLLGKLNYKETFGDIRSNGWERTSSTEYNNSISESSGTDRARFHQSLILEGNFPEIMKNLDTLFRTLSQRKIEIFLVTTPVYRTYYDHLLPVTTYRNQEILSGICSKYLVRYFDFAHDAWFGKEDFYDNDHLNSQGAEKFSKMLDSLFIKDLCTSAGP